MKCPICKRPVSYEGNPFRPFCSERCKLIDFGAWANEEYAVPAQEAPPTFEEGEHNPPAAPEGDSNRPQNSTSD
jgi:endogenous inhibitor of DNA gyrase (YacG/DUF329 family)